MNDTTKLVVGNIVLLVVYYIAAHVSLSLSFPTTGGIPLWVFTGVSLGAVLIWGYWLLPATFIGGLIFGIKLVGMGDFSSVIACLLVGIQSGIYVWLSTWLLRKTKLWPNLLIKDIEIIKSFLLTATLSLIVISAFLGFQRVIGLLPVVHLLDTILLWWAGAIIGIVLLTPITLVLCAKPRDEWKGRFFSVALSLSILLLITIIILYSAKQNDQEARWDKFNEYVGAAHNSVEVELSKNNLLLHAMKTYFRNTSFESSEKFNGYTHDLSDYQSSMAGVAWIDYVLHQNRLGYESKHGGEIVELEMSGRQKLAEMRPDYFVIRHSHVSNQYIKAIEQRKDMNMFDLCFSPERTAICQQAVNNQKIMLLPPILEKYDKNKRFVSILPVMGSGDNLIGMVAHMYNYKSLFNVVSQSISGAWIGLRVVDISNSEQVDILFDSQKPNIHSDNPLEIIKVIEMGGRQWQLSYQPTPYFMHTYSNGTLYWILASAAVILSLMSGFLLAITGRMQQVRQEVVSKTKEIKKSEDKFRQLVEGIQGEYILYSHDAEGVFTYVSPSIEKILGYSQDESMKHYAFFMTDSPLNELVEGYTQKVLDGDDGVSYELEAFSKQGSKHIFKIREHAKRDDNGHIIGVDGIAHDITQSKFERLQLEKLSLAVENSPNAVVITDLEGIIEYVNPKFTEIGGYSSSEVMGIKPLLFQEESSPDGVYDDFIKTAFSGKEWKGEFERKRKNGELYWSLERLCPLFNEKGVMTHFVGTQEDITKEKQLREEKSYQASHDVLTGLINRREFEPRLERTVASAKHNKSEHALAFIDLDRFKVINDTCGHMAGDELLRQIGNLLLTQIRQRDSLARLGGDEFALIIEHCGIEQAYDACQKIIDSFAEFRFRWEEHVFSVGLSIGLTSIDQYAQGGDEVMRRADLACYLAKDMGRNRVEVHAEHSDKLKQRKNDLQWEDEINAALYLNRFLLYAQAITPLQTDTKYSRYEILLRLKMPDDTIVTPGAFLPAAERYNLATKIDHWVIQNTLLWMEKHVDQLTHIDTLSINLSGQSLGNVELLTFIIDAFEKGKIEAKKITFEITETAAIANLREATNFMDKLVAFGCHFSLDDFGSGLSSFAYLKNIKVDTLKIDGMFVKDMLDYPIDQEMVKSINGIGHVMGLKTIAEFVEDEKTADKLREIGVDYAQGYAFGKPVPVDDILKQ